MPPEGPPAPNAALRFAAAGFRSGLKSAPAGDSLALPKMAVLKAVAKFKALPREKDRYFDGVFRGQGIAHNLKMHLENHHKVNIVIQMLTLNEVDHAGQTSTHSDYPLPFSRRCMMNLSMKLTRKCATT